MDNREIGGDRRAKINAMLVERRKKEHYQKIALAHNGKKHSPESRVKMMVSQRKRWAKARGEDGSSICYEDVYDEFLQSEKYQMMLMESEKGGKKRMSLRDAIRYAKSNNGVKMEVQGFVLEGCDA